MKHLGKTLLEKNAFSEIVMGNTAIVRAIVEAGVKVVTSYPGSPTPEIATAIKEMPKEHLKIILLKTKIIRYCKILKKNKTFLLN